MIDRQHAADWLERYLEAWRTYDPEKIGDLFSEDAAYLFSPFDADDPLRGRQAIVENWLAHQDDPGSWSAEYRPIAVEGSTAVTQGQTRYLDVDGEIEKVYENIFVIDFDDSGRCTRFTEWYMTPRG